MNNQPYVEKAVKKITRPRGRPPEFNQEQALAAALQVFWARGYEGASMTELVEALGINKPSIYAAFGNKEALFHRALEMYISGPAAFVSDAMREATARKVAEKFLLGAVEFLTDKTHPAGCMIIQGALTCGQGSELIQQELAKQRQALEANFRHRFELAQSAGDLPATADSAVLAKYLITIHQGMSVQATTGASKSELLSVVRIALECWPAA